MPDYGDSEVIFDDGDHKFVWLGAGDPAHEDGMPSHQYMIVDHGDAYILDPGGHRVFERVHANVAKHVDPARVKGLFLSHQDPDVAAGIALWLEAHPTAQVMISGLWVRFLLHNPIGEIPEIFVIEDTGDELRLPSGNVLRFIPAHFLHSPGNFQLYDERSKILFSGDVGAAIVEVEARAPRVERFDEHVALMEDFHRRYMACNKAVSIYLKQLAGARIQIDTICPQHGAIMEGEQVQAFFSWLGGLDVGVDCMS